ncbi:chemotaxis protein CheA [Rhodoferax saidenbachensis]|uniref:Chemotaxis protein CheA n=1 Tax=Rhodoferax saidenbachensis TaxID=1484693 RepID=A0ABU1ZSY6_9BURK|nr:chemotaxis protein CheA [Rhodoferax saidenbachensis]MDR7308655.1 two-component system chemotaxis sensor kinase CheA [Rhodoferax saidenbachensis]
MNFDDALQTFIAEARDLLQHMEEALLCIEQAPDDADTVNAIFRAAHTIKGSAGLFGLDGIVAFTHVAESVLDKVRANELDVTPELVAVLLQSGDHMRELVDHIAQGGEPSSQVLAQGQALVEQLSDYLDDEPAAQASASAAKVPVEFVPVPTAHGGGEVQADHWHLSLRFGRDVLRNGMDPLSFIRYLGTLGQVVHIVTLLDAIPPVASMDPETCYLGFEIGFKSEADKATIENVFEFVREDCRIRILPPHSKIDEYRSLLGDMPQEQDLLLGDMLVRCGTLTQNELDTALRIQQAQSHMQGEATPPIGEVLVGQHMVQPPVVDAALEKQKQRKDGKAAEANLIRVDADKLDALINLVGELIIAGAGASLAARRAGVPELLESTATISRLVEEVRDSALDLRMVQIGGTFNRFQRVVRDVGKELGKDIELVISGADTELDKTVVERIGDPLTHLVRNSMDHGIESAELRLARGKPAKGTLKLNAFHDAGSIVIEVSDDGGGLNKERILKKAIERGLVNEGQALSDKEIHNLIFEAGFSTADAVSNLSGRGVGMDVVRRNIAALRGTVDLDSVEGQGSTVRIRLPLTLAIIDGFLVGVGNAVYVIPLDMVVECIELSDMDHESGSDKRYLNLRGEVLPYRRLREHFEVVGEAARRENIVVVRYGEHKAGLVVDRLMGEFQTVIKPLGKVFNLIRGIGGFTILGSGEVALILDVPGLMRQVMTGEEPMEEHTRALALRR